MKLLVGLGNPGLRYERTRHNVGFMVVDALAGELGVTIKKKQGSALLGKGFISGKGILLAKPQTFMNRSGDAVLELLNFYRDTIEDLIVIHDDLDIDLGRLRFRDGGGTGGHNGLKSITARLNSADYARLKIGIGRPHGEMEVDSFVLSNFSVPESEVIANVVKTAAAGLKTWCWDGLEKAMNDFNSAYYEMQNEQS